MTRLPTGSQVSDAWTRITAPTATMGAVYMKLESADGDKLVSAAVPTDIAGKTEIHETVTGGDEDPGTTMDGGIAVEPSDEGSGDMERWHGRRRHDGNAQMKDGLELPAGEQVSLEPGGYHVMLLELQAPIAEGDTVPVTLTFEKAGEVQVDAQARNDES